MTDGTRTSAGSPSPHAFSAKPPLWQPPSRRPSLGAWLLGGVCGGAAVLVGLALFAPSALRVPLDQVQVTVEKLEGGMPPDEGPGAFRHLVVLPDESKRIFTCERVLRPGEKLVVSRFRWRFTGHISVGPPYYVLRESDLGAGAAEQPGAPDMVRQ